jgi:hypothetical protein
MHIKECTSFNKLFSFFTHTIPAFKQYFIFSLIIIASQMASAQTGSTTTPGGYQPCTGGSTSNTGSTTTQYPYEDSTIVPPMLTAQVTAIKAQHILDLRTALNNKRTACGQTASTWTNTVATGSTIQALDLNEIRNSILNFATLMATTANPITLPNPPFTDAIIAGVTPVKAVHVTELRSIIDGVSCGAPPSPPYSTSPVFATTFSTVGSTSGTYTAPTWNSFRNWLLAQYAAAGASTSGIDMKGMSDQYNANAAACRNIGDGDTINTYSGGPGIVITLETTWTGLEYSHLPVGKVACDTSIGGHITGLLNNWTCQ